MRLYSDRMTQPDSLFSPMSDEARPLAERMRPRALADMVGQKRLLGEGSALRRAIEAGRIHSMVLWGPPGCGKTTLALLLAKWGKVAAMAIGGLAVFKWRKKKAAASGQ